MNSHILFAKTKPIKLFFKSSLPGAVGMLASALYLLIDGIFVGQILGETAFASLNLAMPFVIINFAVADLIGVGSSVQISLNLGRKNEKEANNLFTCSCMMIVCAGIALGAILFFSAPFLIGMMGAEGEFAVLAVQYLRVYALCSPITTIMFAMDNYLRICGKARTSMALNIFMSLLSAFLEFLFLFVFRWGIWGAALATCLGMCTCVIISIIPFLRKKLLLKFCKPHFNLSMMKKIFACGSPNFLNNIAGRVTSIIMNIILVSIGGQKAVSIYGILLYVEDIVQPLLYGMCDSLQPAVGYNWGAGKFSRVKALEKCCYIASAVVSFSALVVVFFFPQQITNLFMSKADLSFIVASSQALRIFSFTFMTRWITFATQSFIIAIEKQFPAIILSVATAFVFPVTLIFVFMPLGLNGIWLNSVGTALLSAITSIIILLKLRKHFPKKDASLNK